MLSFFMESKSQNIFAFLTHHKIKKSGKSSLRVWVRIDIKLGWYFKGDSISTSVETSKSPTYPTQT